MSAMRRSIARARGSVRIALAELEAELLRHVAGQGTVSSPEQLKRFKENLIIIDKELETGELTFSHVGIGRVITDSWPFDTDLGELLLQAEQDYLAIRNG